MSLHMLFGLKVKHPSGLRLSHFFNRWDVLHFFFFVLKRFKCICVEKSSENIPKAQPVSVFCCSKLSAICFTSPAFQMERVGSD